MSSDSRRFSRARWSLCVGAAALVACWLVPAAAQDTGPGPYMGYGDEMGPGPGMGPDDGMGPDEGMGPGGRMGPGGPGGPEGGAGYGAPPDERVVTVHGQERGYAIHIPPNVTRPAPLVLVFHGGGGRPEAIERRTGMDRLADEKGFVVVYPAGMSRGGGGRRGTWNVGSGQSPSRADDVAFVQAILRDVERSLPIDHARIYATGVSMGGVFSYRLACEMSDTFAAIAPVSATMVEHNCHPNSPVAVLHIHGDRDNRIPIGGGHGEMTASGRSWPSPREGVASWRKFDSCGGAPEQHDEGPASCTIYSQCRATVEYCVLAGEGHGWPEMASARIWAFFAAHPKQAP